MKKNLLLRTAVHASAATICKSIHICFIASLLFITNNAAAQFFPPPRHNPPPAFTPTASTAQGRQYIKEQIAIHQNCRNVAITRTNGDLMIHGRNGYACSSCPQALLNKLKDLNAKNIEIRDVDLTENGSWVVVDGSNNLSWSNVPFGLEQKMREFNRNGYLITSVTFNDNGEWIIISTGYFAASSPELQQKIKDGIAQYGQIWSACITNDACVIVYERGYKYIGDVPQSLQTALRQTSLNVYRVKIAGTSWFFADRNGSYQYNM